MTTTATPDLTTQTRLLDTRTVGPFVTDVPAHPNGWHCYLSPPCPAWHGCDCPPHQYLSAAPRH